MCCISLHTKNAQLQIHLHVDISKTKTAQDTQRKRKLDYMSVPMSTHYVYSRKELNEFRLKREVYSMFLLILCLHELTGTAVDSNFSRIVLLTLFTDVLFVEPLMQINSICLTTEAETGTLESQLPIIYSKAVCLPGLLFSSVTWRLFQRDLLVFCSVWRFSSARDLLSVLHPVTGRKGAGTCGEVTLQCDSRTIQMNDYILAGIDPGLWNKGHTK